LPTSLQSLAGLYGVADFLPMQKVWRLLLELSLRSK
jgi:hypothetical protein